MDFPLTVRDVHPSLDEFEQSKNNSNDIINRVVVTIQTLWEQKKK
jgi:hypothetical protein